MKRVFSAVLFVALFSVSLIQAENINPRLEVDTGLRVVFSSVSSDDPYAYYKPYLKTGCRTDYFGILAGYTRYFEYKIIDIDAEVRYIGLNKISLDFELHSVDAFYTGFEFNYLTGMSSYTGTDYIIEAGYDFSKVSLYGEFSYNVWEYLLNSTVYSHVSYDVYLETAFYVKDDFSIDISFDHLSYVSDQLDNDNSKNLFRLGLMKGYRDIFFVMGGVALGWSSQDYFISALDIGINIYPLKNLKLTVMYLFTYNQDLLYAGAAGGSMSNPVSVEEDESFYGNRLIAGISFIYR